MGYSYVLGAFFFVTIIAVVLRFKSSKQKRLLRDKEKDLVMQEHIKASAEIAARKKAQQAKEQKPPSEN